MNVGLYFWKETTLEENYFVSSKKKNSQESEVSKFDGTRLSLTISCWYRPNCFAIILKGLSSLSVTGLYIELFY